MLLIPTATAFAIGWCSVAVNLYSQYGALLQSSDSEHPVCAFGGGLEIHEWFQQTLFNSVISIAAPAALGGLLLAWALSKLKPSFRRLLAGSPDNPSFDALFSVATTIIWLLLMVPVCSSISTGFVKDSACRQTFFK